MGVALFAEADVDKSGTVTWEEFQGYFRDEKIKAYFMALELDMTSAHKIFDLLDHDQSGELELVEFVEGCIQLRGNAKMVDISILQEGAKELSDNVDSVHTLIRSVEDTINSMAKQVSAISR